MHMQTQVRVPNVSNMFKPKAYEIYKKYCSLREEKYSRLGAWNTVRGELGRNALQIGTALLINRLTARYLGVGAWDPEFNRNPNRLLEDSCPVAVAVSTAICSTIPPHYSNYVIAVEYALSIVRIGVEQKAYEKAGITGDPAGPLLKPVTAGIVEMVYKGFEIQRYAEMNDAAKIMRASTGIWGNLVRIAEAGIIIALASYTKILDVFKPKGF